MKHKLSLFITNQLSFLRSFIIFMVTDIETSNFSFVSSVHLLLPSSFHHRRIYYILFLCQSVLANDTQISVAQNKKAYFFPTLPLHWWWLRAMLSMSWHLGWRDSHHLECSRCLSFYSLLLIFHLAKASLITIPSSKGQEGTVLSMPGRRGELWWAALMTTTPRHPFLLSPVLILVPVLVGSMVPFSGLFAAILSLSLRLQFWSLHTPVLPTALGIEASSLGL